MPGMRFTPRSDEYKRVVAILESSEYDNATDMAKDLVHEIADMLWMRDWYAVSNRGSGIHNADWGPFASSAQALDFANKDLAGLGGRAYVSQLSSPGRQHASVNGHTDWEGYCTTCHHPKYDHHHDGNTLGKCGWSKCPCAKFNKTKGKKK